MRASSPALITLARMAGSYGVAIDPGFRQLLESFALLPQPGKES
jgi:hypothetical protein